MVAAGRAVVVTGIGLVSPLGADGDRFWTALIEQRSGIRRLTRFDPTSYPCQIGGEVDDSLYADLIDPRKLRTASKASQLGLAATELALRDAGWGGQHRPERVGTFIGTALGGWYDAQRQYGVLLERGARRVNPFVVNASPNHGSAGEIAQVVGARGPQVTLSNGCPASLMAIGQASALIAAGELDAAVVGGTETPLSPLVFAGMGRTGELAKDANEAPATACRPFDRRHAGLVLSEGACVLVLEAAPLARSRARARILSSGSSCDAKGLFDLDMSGRTAGESIRGALERADLSPAAVSYVSAHANSSPAFDQKEAAVLRGVFGEVSAQLPVSSVKGVLGHPFGASGAFQVAAAALSFEHQLIPPTANLQDPAPECLLRHVIGEPLVHSLSTALITSYGYGGVNACLVIEKP